uniref:Uncharacterized protein n=1 Tax=Romanomermis culicivorax TaxID=13658 RepID=A0A915KBX1_ROMCU
MLKMTGDISVVALYQLEETVTALAVVAALVAPLARFPAQGPQLGILMDSAMEVLGQLESMSLIDSSSIMDAMPAIRSTDLAKKYPHLPWALLNQPFKVEVLTAPDVMLTAPMGLLVLGLEVTSRALEFISNGTIEATPIHKLLLKGEPLLPAVDTVHRAVKQA